MGARRQSWGISIWPIFMVEAGSGPGSPIYTGRDHAAADRALGLPARLATLWNLYQFGLRPIGTEKGLCVSYAPPAGTVSVHDRQDPPPGSHARDRGCPARASALWLARGDRDRCLRHDSAGIARAARVSGRRPAITGPCDPRVPPSRSAQASPAIRCASPAMARPGLLRRPHPPALVRDPPATSSTADPPACGARPTGCSRREGPGSVRGRMRQDTLRDLAAYPGGVTPARSAAR